MIKKNFPLAFLILAVALLLIIQSAGMSTNSSEIINKIKLVQSDIPQGFVFGKIPDFAKTVLKDNPWKMDKKAIKKLAGDIYPGGDFNKISGIHLTILAKQETPHGDDIVCYIILYRDSSSARGEIKKITDFAGYNGDRVIVNVKNNLAIYLHVDDKKNFHYIQKLNEKIKKRLERNL